MKKEGVMKDPKTTILALLNIAFLVFGAVLLKNGKITMEEFTNHAVIITSVFTTLIGFFSKDNEKKSSDIPGINTLSRKLQRKKRDQQDKGV